MSSISSSHSNPYMLDMSVGVVRGRLKPLGSPIHGHTLPPVTNILACNGQILYPVQDQTPLDDQNDPPSGPPWHGSPLTQNDEEGGDPSAPEIKMSSVDRSTFTKHETLWVGMQLSNFYVGRQAMYRTGTWIVMWVGKRAILKCMGIGKTTPD